MTDIIKGSRRMKIKGLLGKETIITEGKIKDTYGWLPKSVWDITKSRTLAEIVKDDSLERYRDGNSNQPLSEFNPSVAKRCLQIWTEDGDDVLDPFMGRGTRGIMAAYFGRNYYGIEVVPSYYDNVKKRISELIERGHEWAKNIHMKLGNAQIIDIIVANEWKEQFDYIYTSPPFWNVEKYESVDGQMSDIKKYDDFMVAYGAIIGSLYGLLKPGKFATYVVNDFRRDGKFHWFSGDTITAFLIAGFELHDIVINVIRTRFISGIEAAVKKFKRTIKYHEYVLTFKKPGGVA